MNQLIFKNINDSSSRKNLMKPGKQVKLRNQRTYQETCLLNVQIGKICPNMQQARYEWQPATVAVTVELYIILAMFKPDNCVPRRGGLKVSVLVSGSSKSSSNAGQRTLPSVLEKTNSASLHPGV